MADIIVHELIPGMIFQLGQTKGMFIASCPHPVYPGQALVIWRLYDDRHYSFDALSWDQRIPADFVSIGTRGDLKKALGIKSG